MRNNRVSGRHPSVTRYLMIATVLTVGGSAGGAWAQGAAGYSPPPKGAKIVIKREFKKNGKAATEKFTHTILEAAGEDVLYRVTGGGVGDGDQVRLFRGIFSYAFFRPGQGWVEYKFDRAPLRALWPLAPGKKASLKMKFGFGAGKTLAEAKAAWKVTETGQIDYQVLREEKVTTPLGSFHAFVIQRDRRFATNDGKRKFVQRRTAWLVPEFGYIVRQTIRRGPDGPKAPRSRIEVIEIK